MRQLTGLGMEARDLGRTDYPSDFRLKEVPSFLKFKVLNEVQQALFIDRHQLRVKHKNAFLIYGDTHTQTKEKSDIHA